MALPTWIVPPLLDTVTVVPASVVSDVVVARLGRGETPPTTVPAQQDRRAWPGRRGAGRARPAGAAKASLVGANTVIGPSMPTAPSHPAALQQVDVHREAADRLVSTSTMSGGRAAASRRPAGRPCRCVVGAGGRRRPLVAGWPAAAWLVVVGGRVGGPSSAVPWSAGASVVGRRGGGRHRGDAPGVDRLQRGGIDDAGLRHAEARPAGARIAAIVAGRVHARRSGRSRSPRSVSACCRLFVAAFERQARRAELGLRRAASVSASYTPGLGHAQLRPAAPRSTRSARRTAARRSGRRTGRAR